jgi:hypothetical protein
MPLYSWMIRIFKLSIFALSLFLLPSCGDLEELDYDPCKTKGTLDCPCQENNYCYQLPDLTQLMCVEGMCVQPECEKNAQNANGCVC